VEKVGSDRFITYSNFPALHPAVPKEHVHIRNDGGKIRIVQFWPDFKIFSP